MSDMNKPDDTEKSRADFYKETVFLPKTDFPMRGGLAQKEPEILKKWQDEDLFGQVRVASKGKPKWILHWGPPYANGHAHIGHAFTKSLKDVVNRSWQMMGYDAPLVPGWDCHGLPIEWKIEEQYRARGLNKDDVDKIAFRKECREFAQKWADIQSAEFQRLGVMGDWENPYLTMTNHAESRIVGEIHKFLLNGSLYRGVKPVMWSVVEKTALAEAEVEYKEHKSVTVWVRFPVVKAGCEALRGADVLIWTTTPWTLPSNRAIAYGAPMEYAVYKVASVTEESRVKPGDRLVVCTSLADDVCTQGGITDWSLEAMLKASDLEGTTCSHPLRGQGYDFDVPLLYGEFVTDDSGTGFVHIAPSHGADDFYLGQACGIEITDNVNDDGTMKEHVPLFAGEEIYTAKGEMGGANFAVIKAIDVTGKLVAKKNLKHEYPHSWRSKAPVIFRTTPQWFIAMDDHNKIREKALEGVKQTRWIPAQGERRIGAMIESRPDWCISRQRAWGVPIALFVNKKTGEPLTDEAVLKRIQDAFETEGSDSWWARDAADFLGSTYKAEDYEQVFDIVDVWFESGSTHAFVLEDRPDMKWPADLYLEGSDQHRGWFHSSMLESCGTRGRPPYDNVLTHGFVLDEKGYKMSKSLGNIVAPDEIINVNGADILRLWALTSDFAEDIRIGKDAIKATSDLYRRIRNTLRFLLGALEGMTEDEKLKPAEYAKMPELERLVMHWLADMDRTVRGHIENYEFGRLMNKLHNFCTNELSAFYFDIRKDRLYCDRPDLFERRATRTILAHIYECLTAWLAPYLVYTTEEAWSYRPRGIFAAPDSVHLRTFPKTNDSWIDEALAKKWQSVRQVRRVVLGAIEQKRADKTIGSSLEAHPRIYVTHELTRLLEGVDMAEVSITSQASVIEGRPPENAFKLDDISGIAVEFVRAEGAKCQRSWKILPEVGSDPDYPDVTPRDADAVHWYLARQKAT